MSGTLVIADRIITGFSADGAPEIVEDAAILMENDTIAAIGPTADLRCAHPQAREIG